MKKSLKFLFAGLLILGFNFSIFAQNTNIAFSGFGGGLPSTAVVVTEETPAAVSNSILLGNSGKGYTTSEYVADECCYHLTDAIIEAMAEVMCEIFCGSCSNMGAIPMLFTAPIYSE